MATFVDERFLYVVYFVKPTNYILLILMLIFGFLVQIISGQSSEDLVSPVPNRIIYIYILKKIMYLLAQSTIPSSVRQRNREECNANPI